MLKDLITRDVDQYLKDREDEEHYRHTHCQCCQREFDTDELEEGLCEVCRDA